MKLNVASLAFAIAICSDQTAAADGRVWLRVIPAGEFAAQDGRPKEAGSWKCDATNGERIVAALKAKASDLVIDYEHQTLNAEKNGLPAPAAGWMKDFEWRDSGVWAEVEWTARAKQMIDEGEYKYFSPVFSFDKKTGAVRTLLHGALTNTPAVDGLTELQQSVALSLTYQEDPDMDLDQLLEQLRWMLNLPLSATVADIAAELQKLKDRITSGDATAANTINLLSFLDGRDTEIASLKEQTGKAPDPAKFVEIAVLSSLQGELAEARAEVAALKAGNTDGEVETIVVAALKDGRLTSSLEGWARDLGKKDLPALKNFIEKAQPIAALSQRQTEGRDALDSTKPTLSDDELALCKNLGITAEEYLAQNATA